MLKTLSIRNLVLVEEAHVDFDSGLTVITGETGAGKTVLIEALHLIMGERANSTKVRKGEERAHISASFEGPLHPCLPAIFEEGGVPYPKGEPLIISRELSSEGGSRAFVSSQVVPLSFLGKISPLLIDFVGQNAQILLKDHDQQRHFLDQFGNIDLTLFQRHLRDERGKVAHLNDLKREGAEVDVKAVEEELKGLELLNYISGEEEALFEEFSLLTNSEEILKRSTQVIELCGNAITLCHEIEGDVKGLPLKGGAGMVKEAHFQLCELEHLAISLRGKIDPDLNRLIYLEERLSAIDKAKRKYGDDLAAAQECLRERVEALTQIDGAISEAERGVSLAQDKTDAEAIHLTKTRAQAAKAFGGFLCAKLRELNIETAEVEIELSPSSRTSWGDDRVTFFLRTNRGEKMAPVKEAASGGEISRLLFCIKLILSDRAGVSTSVFDEIDAGVGGETAGLMGAQLSRLSKGGQILCVTHFPQVAKQGNHHIRVAKFERDGRTLCAIESLREKERGGEYLRMIGGAQHLKGLKPLERTLSTIPLTQ